MHVEVLGTGSWGTALAILLARNGQDVSLKGRSSEEVEILRTRRENLRYLPGFVIPESVRFFELGETSDEPDFTVVAVPAGAVRSVLPFATSQVAPIVLASKGLEPGGKLLKDVVAEVCPGAEVGVLSGPNLAIEIVRGIPTAAVSACTNQDVAEKVRTAFMSKSFRIYLSDDVVGVEFSGALKNVLAIGAGMSDGLGFGDNTKGALLARGLGEMCRLGVHYEAKLDTFLGVAGVGDLFATASSKLSRNYRVGYAIGQGHLLKEALEEIGQVAEGVPTSEAAMILARRAGVQIPVFEAIDSVLRAKLKPLDAVSMLMERLPRAEGLVTSPAVSS